MKFILRRASQMCDKGKEIEINTLEELIELAKKEKCGIVVDNDWISKDCKELTVYDGYLE